jgi:hypothetical protein
MLAEEGRGDVGSDGLADDAANDFGFGGTGGEEPDFVGGEQTFQADGETPRGDAGVADVFGGGSRVGLSGALPGSFMPRWPFKPTPRSVRSNPEPMAVSKS